MPKHLPPCPDKKNCVCSDDDRKSYHVEPLPLCNKTPAECIDLLVSLCQQSFDRCEVQTKEEQSAHLSFTSAWLGFVDDVHLVVDAKAGLVHIRSASRVGYSDLGINRKRVEKLRALYNERL